MLDHKVEYVVADFHSYPVDWQGDPFGAMSNMTILKDGFIDIDFASDPNTLMFEPIPYFEYRENIKIGQTFVVACGQLHDPIEKMSHVVGVLEYMGTKPLEKVPEYKFRSAYEKQSYAEHVRILDGTSVHEFFHFAAVLKNPVSCNYSDIIKWSVDIIKTDGSEDKEDMWWPRIIETRYSEHS